MTKPTAAPPGDSNMKRSGRGTSGPDQGWSWMVLAASALGLFLGSTIYSTGIFNIAFLEEFHMSKQATAWISGLPGALLALAGPLSSAMTNRLGPRVTVIIGGLVGSAGYLLTVFAYNYYHLLFSFGVITGIHDVITRYLRYTLQCQAELFSHKAKDPANIGIADKARYLKQRL